MLVLRGEAIKPALDSRAQRKASVHRSPSSTAPETVIIDFEASLTIYFDRKTQPQDPHHPSPTI